MKKIKLFSFLFVLLVNLFNAQTTTFVSDKTNQPLPKVSVFGKDGSIIAYSDIDGKIERKSLTPSQEKFQLVYDNLSLGTFSYAELDKDVVKLNDRIKNIEAVVIKNKPAKYMFVKGNFNTYVTVNNRLNCYVDGVITYIFDNKTKKLKSKNVEQYRVFRLQNPKNEKKQTATFDYNPFLEIPEMKNVGNIDDYKKKYSKFKELKGNNKDEVELSGEFLQETAFPFFGYRLFDIKEILNVAFEKDSKKTLRDLLEYNEINLLKLKHKSEENYNQIINYASFYTTEINFSNENDIEKVKFNTDNSNYKTQFWQDSSFPNMQSIFSSFFKEDLKEKENKK